jgi:type IV secretory pathway TrbL component
VELHDKGKRWPQCGSADFQVDCCRKVVPLVASLAGAPGLYEAVEDAIRLTQDNDDAVAYGTAFAAILEAAVVRKPALQLMAFRLGLRYASPVHRHGTEERVTARGMPAGGPAAGVGGAGRPGFRLQRRGRRYSGGVRGLLGVAA